MKTLILSALCWSVPLVSATTGHVYILDPASSPKRSSTIEPVPARMLLAQQAGVEDYHAADLARPDVIEAINVYGVRAPLFEEERSKKTAMIYMEGVDKPESTFPTLEQATHLSIFPGPSANSTLDLFLDFARQIPSDGKIEEKSDDAIAKILQSSGASSSSEDRQVWLYVARQTSQFNQHVGELSQKGYTIAAVFPPTVAMSSEGSIGSEQWGTYTLPRVQSPLRRRELEEPLASDSMASSSSSASTPAPTSNSTGPVVGILPNCFTTLSNCQSLTNNCSGHGTCKQKYSDSTAGDSPFKNCFVCECSVDKSTDEKTGGEKTTVWGGAACQKRDVSVQFWLIALFTIGLFATVSFAIGQIWTMGGEELPSVIGAGVSGPPKR